jgi:hypothetical protein
LTTVWVVVADGNHPPPDQCLQKGSLQRGIEAHTLFPAPAQKRSAGLSWQLLENVARGEPSILTIGDALHGEGPMAIRLKTERQVRSPLLYSPGQLGGVPGVQPCCEELEQLLDQSHRRESIGNRMVKGKHQLPAGIAPQPSNPPEGFTVVVEALPQCGLSGRFPGLEMVLRW